MVFYVQVRLAGAELLPVAVKPNVVDVPAASVPLYDMFFAVTVAPDWVNEALHIWLICWLPGKVQPTLQLLSAEDPAVTVIWAWNPPDQALTTEYVAVQAPPPPPPPEPIAQVKVADPDAPVPSRAVTLTL